MKKILKIIKLLLGIGNFHPGWYLNLGKHSDDRDLKVLGWKGPFKSRKEAKCNIPAWWGVCGIDKPKIRFRIFEPINYQGGKIQNI